MENKKKRGRKPKQKTEPMLGLGDVVELVAKPVGKLLKVEEDCIPCNQKKNKLNKLFPFHIKPTKEEMEYLTEVFEWYKGLPISPDKVDDMVKCEDLYLKLFNQKTDACRTCGAAYQNNYMGKLKELYELYID